MSPLEIIGTVLGVVGVVLMIRQNVWAWPVGLVQVVVSADVFLGAKLYSDVLLQIFFFVIQAYGWWHWGSGQARAGATLAVTRLSGRARVVWVVVGLVVTLLWGEFMRQTTDAALPYGDAFIFIFSLMAQWWQARKYQENWVGWMAVNGVAVGVYWAKDLRLYAVLYGIFFWLAVAGHREWQRRSRPVKAPARTPA